MGDATAYPFKEAAYDLVFSRFGVMFFADPVAAFRNLRRALKPTGRLVFLAWRTPQEESLGPCPAARRRAVPAADAATRAGGSGQYSFGDRARVERILKEAGFATPGIEPLDRPIWLGGTAVDVAETIGRFGPMARAFADAEPAAIEKARTAIAEALAPSPGTARRHAAGCLLAGARGPGLMGRSLDLRWSARHSSGASWTSDRRASGPLMIMIVALAVQTSMKDARTGVARRPAMMRTSIDRSGA